MFCMSIDQMIEKPQNLLAWFVDASYETGPTLPPHIFFTTSSKNHISNSSYFLIIFI